MNPSVAIETNLDILAMTNTRNQVALFHTKSKAFRLRLEKSKEIISQALSRLALPYVAFSGGKDSSVLLHLVREQSPNTRAIFIDDEWNLPETIDLIQRTNNCDRVAMTIPHTEWFTSFAQPKELPDGVIWSDASPRENIVAYAREQGHDGAFIGLRAEESAKRRIMLRTNGVFYFAKNHEMWQAYPLAWWTWRDVWAYILSKGVDYNKAYDKLEEMGIEPKNQRVGPLAVERVLGRGQIVILKRGWFDLYNRFAAEHPEVRSYV